MPTPNENLARLIDERAGLLLEKDETEKTLKRLDSQISNLESKLVSMFKYSDVPILYRGKVYTEEGGALHSKAFEGTYISESINGS